MMTVRGAFLAALLVICLLACVSDVRSRRLPNPLCAVAAIAGLCFAVVTAPAGAPWYSFAAHGVLALVVGMMLFALRFIGGGDAKFYAALACWIPLSRAPVLLIAVCLSGLLVLIAWFAVRRLQGQRMVMGKNADDGAKLPYGVAIALGAILTVAL